METKQTTEQAHTPGPWKVHAGRWVKATYGRHEAEILVAPTYWMEVAPDEAAANARLIAAAPELFEACQLLIADYEDANSAIGDDWYRKAKAAVAKATGEQA